MRVKYLFFLFLGLIFFVNENLLQAAQIDMYSMEEIVNIRLIGKIEKGDAETFKIMRLSIKLKLRSIRRLGQYPI